MKWTIRIVVFLLVLFVASELYGLNIGDAAKLAQEKGSDTIDTVTVQDPFGNLIKLDFKYKLYRLGGIGEMGHWTFYTIKAYEVGYTVVIIYQPEYGAVVILRDDGDLGTSVIIEQDHSLIAWALLYIDRRAVDGMADYFLKGLERMDPESYWDFEPTEEMRPDLCWRIQGNGGNDKR